LDSSSFVTERSEFSHAKQDELQTPLVPTALEQYHCGLAQLNAQPLIYTRSKELPGQGAQPRAHCCSESVGMLMASVVLDAHRASEEEEV